MLLAALLLLGAAPDDADSGQVQVDSERALQWSSGPWRVFPYPEEGTCDLGYSAPNGEYITLAYSARQKAVRLLVTNKHATSVEAGSEVALNVAFLRGGKIVSQWPRTDFETHLVRESERAFISEPLALDFLDEFAKAEFLGILTRDGAGVAGAALEGSAEAIRHLRSCGFSAAGLDAKDPFLK